MGHRTNMPRLITECTAQEAGTVDHGFQQFLEHVEDTRTWEVSRKRLISTGRLRLPTP